jgi:cytochrome c oxidase subunit 2
MRRTLTGIACLLLVFLSLAPSSQAAVNINGESFTGMEVSEGTIKKGMDIFKSKCSACHAIDRRMTGPALAGVHERRELDWLIKWIRNNQELRNSGDADAIAIYNEYNGAAMNVFTDLSDEDIKSVLMYVENGGWTDAKVETVGAAEEVVTDPSLLKNINWILILLALLVGVVIILIIKTIDMVGKYTGREVVPWNNVNAALMLIFLVVMMGLAFYEYTIHGKYILLGDSSSEHGVRLDKMMSITFAVTIFVFLVTEFLLFWFAFKYRAKKGVKALFYPDNDKLELIWTIIPAIVLTILVIGGLNAWRSITADPEGETSEIELFAFQFGWQARYPGADGTLGNANYNLISGTNPLGIAVEDEATALLGELAKDIETFEANIAKLPYDLGKLKGSVGGLVGKEEQSIRKQIAEIESGGKEKELRDQIARREIQIRRIKEALAGKEFFSAASADDIVSDEIHLVVNEPVTFKFRARDVIHSALMKEFRAQMNVVPGLPTQFSMTPTKTTKERRDELKNQEFDYYLICNKICGNSHFNMKLKIVVEDKASYEEWMRSQKATFAKEEVKEVAPATDEPAIEENANEMVDESLALNN